MRTAAKVTAIALSGAIAASSFGVLDAISASATTGNAGLPQPAFNVNVGIGSPFAGRFFLSKTERHSRVAAAIIDIAWGEYEEPADYLLGEFELRTSEHGRPVTVTGALYPWKYVESKHILTAGLVPPTSVSEAHPAGVALGRISLTVPPGVKEATGKLLNVNELPRLNGTLQIGNRSPYSVEFTREDEQRPPPVPMPRAKLVTKLASKSARKAGAHA